MRLGLFGKIFLYFALLVIALGGVATWLGVRSVTRAVYHEAQTRVNSDLRIARLLLDQEAKRIETALAGFPEKSQLVTLDSPDLRKAIDSACKNMGLDYLTLVNPEGEVLANSGQSPDEPASAVEIARTMQLPRVLNVKSLNSDEYVKAALGKAAPAAGVAIVPREELEDHSFGLAERARMIFLPTPRAHATTQAESANGMALEAAVPIIRRSDGQVIGGLVGGVLLNRNYDLVDRVKDLVFSDEKYDGRDVGTVTIFQWDVRVSTNVMNRGERAICTRVSDKVYQKVLEQGQTYNDRAFVVNDWYLTAYEPLKDFNGQIIGMLYVGVLETKFSALRTDLLRQFLYLTGGAVLIALVVSGLFAQALSGSLRRLAEGSRMMAEGRLDWRVEEPRPKDEVRDLSIAFNQMAEALDRQRQELDAANRRLNSQNQDLERLNRNYMEMLGFVTHELKGPLHSSMMSASALRQEITGPLTDQQKRCVALICRSLEYSATMIRNYLDLSRIEKDELQVNPVRFNLKERVLQPIALDLEPALHNKEMTLEMNVPDGLEIAADPLLMRVVFQNLVGNAIKYGREGGRIAVRADIATNKVTFTVWNEGVGIAPPDIGKLFQKFGRIADSRTEAEKGTGLGLFITKNIILKHGGEIGVESEEGKWIQFRFTLPKPA